MDVCGIDGECDNEESEESGECLHDVVTVRGG